MALEVEIKLPIADLPQARAGLAERGFRLLHARTLEKNIVFDTAEAALRRSGQLLRLRDFNGKNILTYKGPAAPGPHKSREEIELEVSAAAAFQQILERLGYRPVFLYEKYRSEYERYGDAGLIMLDETPIGNFFELEGPPDWIDSTAAGLGFPASDYITQSYGALYAAYRKENPQAPPDMVFPDGR